MKLIVYSHIRNKDSAIAFDNIVCPSCNKEIENMSDFNFMCRSNDVWSVACSDCAWLAKQLIKPVKGKDKNA
jgi:hypothetical protein